MIEEIGTVSSVSGLIATVDVPKKSACEGCTAGTCNPEDKVMRIEAVNRAGAAVGQRVRVLVQPSAYMKGTMMVYGIPAIFLVAGAVLGKDVVSRFMPGKDPDVLSALFGMGAFVVSLLVVKILAGRVAGNTESKPVVDEILG